MSGYVRWKDIRAEHIERAGGEEAIECGKREIFATALGRRLVEARRAQKLTQQQVADRMGITTGQVPRIEHGKISEEDVLVSFSEALNRGSPGDLPWHLIASIRTLIEADD